MAQPVEGLRFKLPDALACDADLPSDFFQSMGFAIEQPIAQFQDVGFALRETGQDLM